ncbi:MAG: 4-carboxymuconolactone decarboxylase [Solirubrobacterales bacterium]|jgi:AhpD family alkylhydroperoxidase|nr:4-carboxymuconolactone decarboxylase [Solirubrobacterales bacterium]MCW3024867.1 4-carboxymuconolactone decarboxylase [Solirubrobacterales bacterium]
MSRIERVGPRQAGPLTGLVLRLARRKTRQLAGGETEGMIGPLEAYAQRPRLLLGYGLMEDATARLDRVPERLKVLAELKAATMTSCEYCIDIGSQIGRRAGLSDEQLLALPRYRDSDLFGELEKLVLDYAVGMSRTPVEVSDELFAELRESFDDGQLVELTNVIALENMRGRFNLALGFGSAGFSDGMVCALPERPASEQVAVGSAA